MPRVPPLLTIHRLPPVQPMTLSSRMLYIWFSLLRFDLFSFIHAEDLRMVTSRGTWPK